MPAYGWKKMTDGHRRYRCVQPGYDPNDESVPPNKVIFDSDDLGTLSVLARGTVSVPSGNTGSMTAYAQIVTWNLPYVPLCWFEWDTGNGFLTSCYTQTPALTMLNIRKTGIYLWSVLPVTSTLHYTAFRTRAANG